MEGVSLSAGKSCECSVGYAVLNACVPCQACLACSSPSVCTSCSGFLVSGVCSCPAQSFMQHDSSCIACSAYCQLCTSTTACTLCLPNYRLESNACVCPEHFYLNNDRCQPCVNGCLLCSSTTTCISCYPSLIISIGSTCDCPAGQYPALS
jgi:hypothetical protein